MDSLRNIINDLAYSLDVDIQEGVATAEISNEVLERFLKKDTEAQRSVAITPSIIKAPEPITFKIAEAPTAIIKKSVETLDSISSEIATCKNCHLAATRTNTVPGIGCLNPDVMFIGEAPGAEEDAEGKPFVGRAGQLLGDMIRAMGYTRESVYIANILKCRPPENRTPAPDEMAICIGFLKRQIAIVKPKIIVALGAVAVRGLLNTDSGITRMRGRWFAFEGIPLMPTFHPAYLLRLPAAKREAWSDLKAVLKRLGKEPPAPQKKPKAQN